MPAYATVSELATYMGLADNYANGQMRTTGQETRFQQALDAASALIDQDCNRAFSQRTAVKDLISEGGDTLRIPDLVSVTSLRVDDDGDGTFETVLPATDYELNYYNNGDDVWPYEYIIRIDTWWPRPTWTGRRKLVRIDGVWGWPSVPVAIKQATLIQAARLVQRSNAALGVQGISDFGPFSIRNNDPDYTHLISRYVKVSIG